MTREAPPLAKLTRPRTQGILPRQRLFDLLDRSRQYPVVWIVGPPGAGKTSLVASYLEARRLPALWYDVDGGESDPATFFYYLQLAAAQVPQGKRAALPLLTAEFVGDLSGFARRFFQSFYARLPNPSVLVLDNYHEVTLDSSFHAVIEHALSRVPEGLNVMVISRAEPPAQCARHVANRQIAQIDFDDLRLTFDETSDLARARRKRDDGTLRALHTQADGWAAGTILMLERLDHTGELNHTAHPETMGTVFNYFAGQVFADLPPGMRDVLVRTSFLPHVTVRMAEQISGNAEAGKVLNELCQRHLFTDRRTGDELTYRYHALFRAFLRDRARELLPPEEYARQCHRAASLLDDIGETEHALALHIEQKAWDHAKRLVLRAASTLMRQGRQQTLAEWIGALPDELAEDEPWLRFWQGTCVATAEPRAGRSILEDAHRGFVARGDKPGQMLSAAAVIETYAWDFEFASVRSWIVALESLLSDAPHFQSSEMALRVYSAFLIGAFYEEPTHPLLRASVDRIESMLLGDAGVRQKVTAGTFLLGYCVWGGGGGLEQRIIARIQPLMSTPGVTALDQVWWRLRLGSHLWLRMDYEGADRVLAEARKIAEANGLQSGEGVNCMLDMMSAAVRDDMAAARLAVMRVETKLSASRRSDRVYAHLVKSLEALMHGDTERALSHIEAAADVVHDLWFPIRYFVLQHHVQALVAARRYDEARQSLESIRALVAGTGFGKCEHEVSLLEAGIALSLGDVERCRAALRVCLPFYRREGAFGQSFRWLRGLLVEVLSAALEADIEVDYVSALIERARLIPTSPDIERWPWPIRVYTLGDFRVFRDGEALAFAGKAQKRPMELLKALIALGGHAVDLIALMGILWPDATGDAQKSLEMALSRLRKLLGQNESVLLQELKLTLNPRLAWVDTWAFERSLSGAADVIGGRAEVTDSAFDDDRAYRAFALYKGRFLASEPKAAWMQATADRLHAKFIRLVLTLGHRCEATSWEQAAHIYERGLELENLSEELYRRLMVCHRERGHVADAMNVYRRCRDNLSIMLGVAPSADTVALYDSLRP